MELPFPPIRRTVSPLLWLPLAQKSGPLIQQSACLWAPARYRGQLSLPQMSPSWQSLSWSQSPSPTPQRLEEVQQDHDLDLSQVPQTPDCAVMGSAMARTARIPA